MERNDETVTRHTAIAEVVRLLRSIEAQLHHYAPSEQLEWNERLADKWLAVAALESGPS